MDIKESNPVFSRNISAAGAWAFSIGTSIGWCSLVVTNSTYLGQAGPLGSAMGMVIGAIIMLVISKNYAYMMNAYPDAGGAYAYSRESFGYDHGFLTAWFLSITYFAMFWANATSLPLFARYFLGDVFHFGRMYTLFGYDVYFGEVLLTVAAIAVISLLCARNKKAAANIMLVMAILFTLGIVVCFSCAFLRHDQVIAPAFIPDSRAISQVAKIACVSTWAFIGFESISHGIEEFTFQKTKVFRILVCSVIITTLLYIFVMLLSVSAYPPE